LRQEENEEEPENDTLLPDPGDLYVDQMTWVDHRGHKGVYTGAWYQNRPHGKGKMVYDDAKIYTGQWVKGDWSGYGTLEEQTTTSTTVETQIYQGGFFDNMKHGVGTIKYSNGNRLEGTFDCDEIHEKVHMQFPNGNKYWGYIRDGIPHGRGKQIFVDDTIYDGEFVGGQLHGHGRITWPSGKWYLGEFSEGFPHGVGLEVTNEKVSFQGIFNKGQPIRPSSFHAVAPSSGKFLLYRNSICQGTLVGPLPTTILMNKRRGLPL